jgi:hypothetical protein
MRLWALFIVCFAFGCGESAKDLTVWQQRMREGNAETIEAVESVSTKTDEAIGILKENTTALAAIKSQIDALQVVSKPQQLGGDPKASRPESPAKANTQQTPVQVATPGTSSSRVASDGTRLHWNIEGNWNPTILETSAHLRQDHGIDTDGMTHQEMADIHASIHDGKPVAMKSKPVQFVTRGSSCPGGVCPIPRRGLFGRRR